MALEQERLLYDHRWYARNCLKIPGGAAGEALPLIPRLGQDRFYDALEYQRERDLPLRVIILKARQVGISTAVQGVLVQRATQMRNHRALTIAHRTSSVAALFGISDFMYSNLPAAWNLKPPVYLNGNSEKSKYIHFGEKSLHERRRGNLGINSMMTVATAKETDASRGSTNGSLHGSEIAFWDSEATFSAVMNTVPDEPWTFVALESTANGANFFQDMWDAAWEGSSSYLPIFVSWLEEPRYQRPFADEEERAKFAASVGEGPFGEDEPRLVELGATLEQLHWRRFAIPDKCEGKVEKFNQEYPTVPEDAFIASGRTVFAKSYIRGVVSRTVETDPKARTTQASGPTLGTFNVTKTEMRENRAGHLLEVPIASEWQPRVGDSPPQAGGYWRVWSLPKDSNDRFMALMDPAGGAELDAPQNADHGLTIWNHKTGKQVAEFTSQGDTDLVGDALYLAALTYNMALMVIEITGGWGLSVARRVANDYCYPFVYRRRMWDTTREREVDKLGWDTNRATKPMIEENFAELLRTGDDGIQSAEIARQLGWYTDFGNGIHMPIRGKRSDLLMTTFFFHHLRRVVPPRVDDDDEFDGVFTKDGVAYAGQSEYGAGGRY